MPEIDREELDDRIAIARRNIADLMEQASAASGAAVEDSLANRLGEQQAMLDALLKKREALE